MSIKRVWSKRLQDWGYKVDIGLGTGKDRRRVRLPSEGVFASELQARNAIAQARAEFANQRFLFAADRQVVTVQTIFNAWLERGKKFNRHPEHIRMAERTFGIFAQVLALDSKIDDLNSDHLGDFFKLRRKQGAARQTAYNELVQIMGAMKYAVGHVLGLENWKPPAKPEWVERSSGNPKRAITRDEERLIVTDLRITGDTDMEHLFVIGIYTGMRVGEIFRIDRTDVHDEPGERAPQGTVTAKATKTGKFRLTGKTQDRDIPMTRKVREVLDTRRADWDPLANAAVPTAGPLFPERFNYKRKLKQCCKRVGIPYGRNTPGGITFHSTRHTFVSRLTKKGESLGLIGKLTGQKRIAQTSDYAHVTAADLGEAIEGLDDSEE